MFQTNCGWSSWSNANGHTWKQWHGNHWIITCIDKCGASCIKIISRGGCPCHGCWNSGSKVKTDMISLRKKQMTSMIYIPLGFCMQYHVSLCHTWPYAINIHFSKLNVFLNFVHGQNPW
jgi:hypothetical protein